MYCRSNLGDKISDYEDLWTQENGSGQLLSKGPLMSSFRPENGHTKRPDLLPETRKSSICLMKSCGKNINFTLFISAIITSLSENLLSPAGSIGSTNASSKSGGAASIKSSSDQNTNISDEMKASHQQIIRRTEIRETHTLKEVFSPTTEINRLQIVNELSQQTSAILNQPGNRLGVLLSPTAEIPSPVSDTTPIQTPVQSRSKQNSPFYAEPADALGNVIRRSQRGNLLNQSQRHSEPPKHPLRPTQFCQVLSPIESEKSHISGSLDELKKKNRKTRGRLDPWPLDSSWEFMGNDDQNDYDTDANWKASNKQQSTQPSNQIQQPNNDVALRKSPLLLTNSSPPKQEKRLTINQIIAKKLPELKIAELVQKTTMTSNLPSELNRMGSTGKNNRMSSYDNVERGHSGYASSMLCPDSAQSDDGTVFSEPWDSSQWDSFFTPPDGGHLS